MSSILVIEDDENLRVALCDNLEDEGHTVTGAGTIAAGRAAWEAGDIDLVVLDLMLPDGDGYSLCRARREAGDATPVLMLTARTLEDDLVRGFEAGADDYLSKPYRLRELMARVSALLRRAGAPHAHPALTLGGFTADQEARVLRDPVGGEVPLTRTEFDLLVYLMERPGVALSRDDILDAVWGTDVVVDPRTVDNFVSNLKKKLGWTEGCGWHLRAVRGVGYRLERG